MQRAKIIKAFSIIRNAVEGFCLGLGDFSILLSFCVSKFII